MRHPPDAGETRWELRRDLMVETIRGYGPDLIGTQELFQTQASRLRRRCRNRVRNFWLSETADKPGSVSWAVTLPRMVTWGRFEITDSSKRFYYYNTHFPHRREDAAARLKFARVVVERAALLPSEVPFILTGDFNAPADGDVHHFYSRGVERRLEKRAIPFWSGGHLQRVRRIHVGAADR